MLEMKVGKIKTNYREKKDNEGIADLEFAENVKKEKKKGTKNNNLEEDKGFSIEKREKIIVQLPLLDRVAKRKD